MQVKCRNPTQTHTISANHTKEWMVHTGLLEIVEFFGLINRYSTADIWFEGPAFLPKPNNFDSDSPLRNISLLEKAIVVKCVADVAC